MCERIKDQAKLKVLAGFKTVNISLYRLNALLKWR